MVEHFFQCYEELAKNWTIPIRLKLGIDLFSLKD